MAKNEKSTARKQYKNRFKNDDSYERNRENIAEFTVAMKAGKLIRNAFRTMIKGAAINGRSLVTRMQKALMTVLKSDTTSVRGERLVSKGNLNSLKDFDFNEKAFLSRTLSVKAANSIDRVSGNLTIQLPAFIPTSTLAAAAGTSHFRIVHAVAEFDFDKEDYILNVGKSDYLPYVKTEIAPITVETSLTPDSKQAFVQLIALEFYQEVNGNMYLLKDDTRSAIAVLSAESAIV